MSAKTALCPSCGAPVEFHSAESILLVCRYCRSTLLRSAEKIENLGRMADLIEDFSSIQIGSEGRYRGKHFGVIGRIQLKYPAGVWNEWHLLFDDTRNGWLSDANGEYTVSFVEKETEKLGAFDTLRAGNLIPLGGKAFEITNIEKAMCIAGDGELPFKVGAGYPAPLVDARFGNIFASIDYSEDPPMVFIGETVERESLSLSNLRQDIPSGEPTEKGLKALDCPSCGAPISISSQATQRVACTGCGSLLDNEDSRLKLIQKASGLVKVYPAVPIGSKGKLRGAEYEVIGFMQRNTTVEGIVYSWDEYLLFDRRGEFRWLSCSDGHWNFIRVLNKPPVSGSSTSLVNAQLAGITFENEKYRHFQNTVAVVTHVLGEFNWRVSVDDRSQIQDFVAPPKMLSRESTDNEIVWSLGEYITPEEIRTAFKLKEPLRTPVGIYANQPNPRTEAHQRTKKVFKRLAGVSLLLHVIFMLLGFGGTLSKENLVFGNTESSHTTKAFDLNKRTNTIWVENDTNFDNGWLDLNLELVDEASGQVWHAQREISYYSGVEGGESWSEGSHSDDVVFADLPPGHYHLTVDGQAAPELTDKVVSKLSVQRGGARWSNFFLLFGLLTIFPIWSFFRCNAFENQRWMESDHPPVSSSE